MLKLAEKVTEQPPRVRTPDVLDGSRPVSWKHRAELSKDVDKWGLENFPVETFPREVSIAEDFEPSWSQKATALSTQEDHCLRT